MADEQQYSENQMLAGSDGNTYVVRGGVPRLVVPNGGAAPAGPSQVAPVYRRPQSAPLPTPIGPKDTPEYRANVARAEEEARLAARREAEQALSEEGRVRFRKAVSFLRRKYDALNERGEMISSKNPWYDNVSNWSEAQAVSFIGNPTGSQNQSDREAIINQRNILIPLLMQATGANSRMIDSNSEAQRFLNAVTSPTQSYETVMDSLNNVEELFGAAVQSLKFETGGSSLLPSTPKFKVKRRN